MAGTTISALPAAPASLLTDVFAADQGGATTYKETLQQVLTLFKANGSALTSVNDTNVTVSLGGTPSTALLNAASLNLGWSGQLSVPRGGTGNSTFTAYSVICGGTTATGAFQNVVGLGSSGQQLTSNGPGALPTWQASGAVTPAALTKVDDTNVTLALGGTPSTALLQATSITAGWTGQLSVARGGTGLAAFLVHYIPIGNGTALTLLGPSATSGVPLISQGVSADPAYGTAVVAGGGTGNTTFTAYSVICAGTTATGTFQNVSGVGTSGQVLTSNGAAALPTWQASGGVTPAALTKTDDTNVTLTLGGTPSTALLQATSITVGWSGQLGVARGGTGASTFTAGSAVFAGTSGTYTQDNANYFYDSTNHRLGLGTTTPNTKLQIIGGGIHVGNTASILGATGESIEVGPASGNASFLMNRPTSSDAGSFDIVTGGAINTGWSIQMPASQTYLQFLDRVNSAARLVILNTGRVGILTATPSSALHVNGTATATLFSGSGAQVTSIDAGNVSTGTLAVARGGTGTGTAFTTGSVVFAGASGVYTQDNAKFFWDDTNFRLGIGTATPATALDVSGTVSATTLTFGTSTSNGITGVTSTTAAGAGVVGEVISSIILQASAVSVTTSPSDITSISLTAGQWDLWGNVLVENSSAVLTNLRGWIHTVSATSPDAAKRSDNQFAATAGWSNVVPGLTLSVNTTTTVYLSVQASFAAGTSTGSGQIYARRRR